jgi:hypothetical protein
MSEGHVSGMNHLAEAVRQLRGEVPAARQIANVSTVAVVTEGNFLDGAMTVLSKDAGRMTPSRRVMAAITPASSD